MRMQLRIEGALFVGSALMHGIFGWAGLVNSTLASVSLEEKMPTQRRRGGGGGDQIYGAWSMEHGCSTRVSNAGSLWISQSSMCKGDCAAAVGLLLAAAAALSL